MSLERRERRRCDKCKEIISGKYYSCEQKNHINTEDYQTVPYVWVGGSLSSVTFQPPVATDVCQDCWEKMEK